MTNENVKNSTFVLKDQDGNFVSSGSIYFYEETKRIIYSYSKFHTNGFFSHPTWAMAQVQLDRLNQLEDRFKIGKQFHIEEMDRYATLLEESKSGELKVGLSSIKHEYHEFAGDFKRYWWVIKDSQGNYANANSVKKWNSKTWMYVTFKEFSPECRGYLDLMACERAMDKLWTKINKMRLNESFTLEYINLDEVINQYKSFQGENMVLIEKVA